MGKSPNMKNREAEFTWKHIESMRISLQLIYELSFKRDTRRCIWFEEDPQSSRFRIRTKGKFLIARKIPMGIVIG